MQELLVVEVIPREKGRTSIRFDNGMEVLLYKGEAVSYTHLTLPTKRIVEVSVDAVHLKKKK